VHSFVSIPAPPLSVISLPLGYSSAVTDNIFIMAWGKQAKFFLQFEDD